jgi:uncharacterized damage-inducible protein DinB
MPIAQGLLPEFDMEMASTRRTLERVPTDKFSWKPHPRSGAMGWLAGHIAFLPMWLTLTLSQDSLDIEPGGVTPTPPPLPESRDALLAMFDKHVAEARAALAGASDETLMKTWTLLKNGKTVFQLPKVAVVRSFVLNHIIHHRAQLGVYLRMNDLPVPAVYGPSADETPF